MISLTHATLVELDPPSVQNGTVVIHEGRIAAIIDGPPPPDSEVLDCAGAVVIAGLTCAHTHLYSTLARGMPPPAIPPENFVEILERVWWKLDRALDAETIEVSAAVGALEAAKAGTTTLIDHHASPSSIEGSLDRVAQGIERVGLRGVLCYEVSDRGGEEEARAGLRENDRFLTRVAAAPSGLVAGLVGAHAAFTLSDKTAASLAEVVARHQKGLHIHVAEDRSDALRGERSTIAWLKERSLLANAWLAHAVHVSPADVDLIREAGAHVVHNPRSNANNAVGYARPSRFGEVLLGTDGIGADMLSEARAGFLLGRDHGDPIDVLSALTRSRSKGAVLLGVAPARLEVDAPADLAVFDYRAPTPIWPNNLFGHLLFGLAGARTRHTLVAGRVVVKDGQSTTLDEAALYARSRELAHTLWKKMT